MPALRANMGRGGEMSTKWLGEFDQQLLDEALGKLTRVYEYNYSTSRRDKASRRLETIMKKIGELKELEIELTKEGKT